MLYMSTLFGFFGRVWWVFELFSHFRVQYFYALLVCAFLFILYDDTLLSVITSCFILLNLAVILPLYRRSSSAHDNPGSNCILFANVLTSNLDHEKVQKLIQDVDPDFVALIEVNQAWLDDLKMDQAGYPFIQVEPREDNYGIALFSRYPLLKAETMAFGTFRVPSLIAQCMAEDGPLTLIVTHSPPPRSADGFRNRNQHLGDLSGYVRSLHGAVMVVGDLNITSWSPFFNSFLQSSGLRDSRLGFGVQPTWPADIPLMLIPIDHAVISPHIEIIHRAVGPKVGSDHYPIIIGFSISGDQSLN
jgi:endonuclease/exonuclease/phosphatase (EEP) superfamily protein YafD